MRHNDASAHVGSRASSRTAWLWASSALLALVLAACGSTVGSGAGGAVTRSVAFANVTSGSYARHDTGPAIVVGTTDHWRATLARIVDGAALGADRVAVAAFQGEQRSGGYAIRIEKIERTADRLVVRATFTEPAPGSINTMALTSPVHVVSIAAVDAAGLKEAVLLDQSGAERARINAA